MARLRAEPPTALGGRAVQRADDLAQGSDGPAPDRRPALPARRRRPGRRPTVGHRAQAQGYLEVVVPVTADDVVTARRTAAADLTAIKHDVGAALNLG